MASASSISLRSIVNHLTASDTAAHCKVFTSKNFLVRFGVHKPPYSRCNQLLVSKRCSLDREMDVSTSTLIDDVELEEQEPSISTMIMNFESKFDPYDAVSTPLYQTATFKQPSATENGPYDYTRSGNPTRDALESLLAKLEKADRAFCFTSGMAALAAVAQLVGTGSI